MKKFISLFVALLVLLIAVPVWSAGDVQIRDRNSANKADVAQLNADNVAATIYGLVVGSHLYGYDGATWDRLTVGPNSSDDVVATTQGLDTRAFQYAYDGVTWDRITATAAGDALSATLAGVTGVSLMHFYDGTNYRRWQGITMADTLTYPTAPFTGAVLLADDGGTLDMLKVSATGALEVEDTSTRPGENAGAGLRHISKKDIAVYTPAKTTTAGVGTAPVIVLASTEIMTLPNWCIYLQNDDGADPFVDADVQVSPDGTAFASLIWTACDSLAATKTCVYCVTGSAYRYVRVYVTATDANDVDVDAWLTANKG